MTKIIFSIVFLFLVCTQPVFSSEHPSCISPTGERVDWFIALKHPNGASYSYCDSIECNSFQKTSNSLNILEESPVLQTLQQIQSIKTNSLGSLFWNDQPPNNVTASSSVAHAKGFMGFSQEKGFLMVHSTPLFPQIQSDNHTLNFLIDSSQQKFGQHYFCISTSTKHLNNIASGYNIDWPKVYGGNIPSDFVEVEDLAKMLSNTRNALLQSKVVEFTSHQNTRFVKLSKSGKWVVPFYENVLAAETQTSYLIESWGSPQEAPSCDADYQVMSNFKVKLGSQSFTQTQDHSKYGISLNPLKPIVCLGDINRQSSQWKRGGGTVCFENEKVYSLFSESMLTGNTCESFSAFFIERNKI